MNQQISTDIAALTDLEHPESKVTQTDAAADTLPKTSWVAYAFLCLFVFATTWLGAIGWMNRSLISDLFYESSLNRYRVATGEAGPATFYVFHSDFSALEKLAQANDEILGIELSEYSGIAAMAFTSLEVDAVDMIRNHSVVRNMLQKDIPMLCH